MTFREFRLFIKILLCVFGELFSLQVLSTPCMSISLYMYVISIISSFCLQSHFKAGIRQIFDAGFYHISLYLNCRSCTYYANYFSYADKHTTVVYVPRLHPHLNEILKKIKVETLNNFLLKLLPRWLKSNKWFTQVTIYAKPQELHNVLSGRTSQYNLWLINISYFSFRIHPPAGVCLTS